MTTTIMIIHVDVEIVLLGELVVCGLGLVSLPIAISGSVVFGNVVAIVLAFTSLTEGTLT